MKTSSSSPARKGKRPSGRIRSILVPIDFSDEAMGALSYAQGMAEVSGAKITLLHVVQPIPMAEYDTMPLLMETDQIVRSGLVQLEKLAESKGLPVRKGGCLVRTGQPFHEICDTARTLGVDLIVVTTHGYTGLKHALLGSVAERVVRHAPCPVLVVRRKPEGTAQT
jgi:universal stress protein A